MTSHDIRIQPASHDDVPSTATIRVAGHHARLTPVIPELVTLFEYEETLFEPQNGRGNWLHRKVSLASMADEGILFSTGALPRVLKYLADRGCNVTVEGCQSLSTAAAWLDVEFAAGLTGWQKRLADVVASAPVGTIASSNEAQKLDQMGLVGRLCHRARVLVAVPTRADCEKYELSLAEYFGANVAWDDGLRSDTCSRVTVCTYRHLQTSDPRDWHVLLLPELESVVAAWPFASWAVMQNHRSYGFCRTGEHWSRRTSLYVEVLAGQIIFEPDDALAKPSLRVVFVEPQLKPTLYVPKSALEYKRQMIWQSVERNRLIAGVARSLESGSQEALWAHGVFLRESECRGQSCSPAHVVVVVEALEHGRELLRLLPGWKLIGLEPTAAATAAAGRLGPNSVVTVAALNQRQLEHMDVVIRADAGEGVLDFVSLMPSVPFSATRKVLLVDIADNCDVRSAADARQRCLDYQRLGVEVSAPIWLTSAVTNGHAVHRLRPRSRKRKPNK